MRMQSPLPNDRAAALPSVDATRFDVLLPLVAFAIPLLVAGPQWLTGTLVNCFLFLAATRCRSRTLALVVLLPSIAAFLHGALFGPLTLFLLPFLPFIWIGNGLLTTSYSALAQRTSRLVAVGASALLKTAVLWLCAFAYVSAHLVPAPFLQSMGLLQLITAVAGGLLALAVLPLTSA